MCSLIFNIPQSDTNQISSNTIAVSLLSPWTNKDPDFPSRRLLLTSLSLANPPFTLRVVQSAGCHLFHGRPDHLLGVYSHKHDAHDLGGNMRGERRQVCFRVVPRWRVDEPPKLSSSLLGYEKNVCAALRAIPTTFGIVTHSYYYFVCARALLTLSREQVYVVGGLQPCGDSNQSPRARTASGVDQP